MSFIQNASWRYATKKFDTAKKVEEVNLETISETIRLTPTSFGLQPYAFYIINNNAINAPTLEAIKDASWNQEQVGTCSNLIVFCSRTDLAQVKTEYFDMLSAGDPDAKAKLAEYETMVTNFITTATPDWAKKQCYIALGFALAACAELSIDSCPMEGFDPTKVAEILKLPANLEPTLLMPIGYRDANENPHPKARFPKEKLFTNFQAL